MILLQRKEIKMSNSNNIISNFNHTLKMGDPMIKMYGNKIVKLEFVFNEADRGLYLTEDSTGQTYAQIFKDVFGEDELTRLQNSIKSTQYSYTDEEGDDLKTIINRTFKEELYKKKLLFGGVLDELQKIKNDGTMQSQIFQTPIIKREEY